MSVIERADGWIFEHDLRREIPGRDDTIDERETCIAYLRELHSNETVKMSQRRA